MSQSWWVAGSLVTSTVTFTAESTGEPADPSAITLSWQPGYQATVQTATYGDGSTITKVSTGVYAAELDTTSHPGPWTVQWTGTGTVQAIAVSNFQVTPAPLAS